VKSKLGTPSLNPSPQGREEEEAARGKSYLPSPLVGEGRERGYYFSLWQREVRRDFISQRIHYFLDE
jgi:hypothetical protein